MKKSITVILFLVSTIVFSQEKNTLNNNSNTLSNPIETPPVYKGCENKTTTSQIKNCTTTRIDSLIKNNFDYSVTKNIGLDIGEYKVYIKFKIDKEGNVIYQEIKKTDYQPLIDEAIRVVNLIPTFVKPATQRGKPVSVNYIFPITFVVEKSE